MSPMKTIEPGRNRHAAILLALILAGGLWSQRDFIVPLAESAWENAATQIAALMPEPRPAPTLPSVTTTFDPPTVGSGIVLSMPVYSCATSSAAAGLTAPASSSTTTIVASTSGTSSTFLYTMPVPASCVLQP